MSKRFPRAKWVLPTVVDPPDRICYLIEVPNERAHIAAFMGALYNLTSAIFWADDTAHTAKDVAHVWQDIFDSIVRQSCKPSIIKATGGFVDDMPFFREVEDNGVCYLEFQCCPDQWIRLARADQLGQPNQPGAGAEQPPPGGGQACYQATMPANSTWLIPSVVNSGDVITVSGGKGAVSNSHNALWRCFSGDQFFAGACVGNPQTFSGDPVNTAPNGSLVVNINGTFYSLSSGSFTVPSGVTNASASIQVNDASIAGLSGEFVFQVCLTNNQAGTWTHIFDWALSPAGWETNPSGGSPGQWVAGVGWIGTTTAQAVNIKTPFFTATQITSAELIYDDPGTGPNASSGVIVDSLGTPNFAVNFPIPASGVNLTLTGSTPNTTTVLGCAIDDINCSGNAVLKKLTLTGTGVDPF